MRKLVFAISVFLLSFTLTVSAGSRTYYVNGTTGNDSWDGTSPTFMGGNIGPKKTIQGGVDCEPSYYDTVIVANGTYTGTGNRDVNIERCFTLRSENGPENCIINCQTLGRAFEVHTNYYCRDTQPLTLQGFTIINGQRHNHDEGGGIYISYSGVVIQNCSINYCWAEDEGGGIFIKDSHVEIIDSTVENNLSRSGAGICAMHDSEVKLTNCQVSQNIAYASEGGGLNIYNCEVEMENCDISNNLAYWRGGGIFSRSGLIKLTSCEITDNLAYDGYGGGIGLESGYSATLDINNCNISDNFSNHDGGGLYGHGCIKNSVINNNLSLSSGGGIYGGFEIYDSSIINNTSRAGGGICSWDGNLALYNCEVLNNICDNEGGGIIFEGHPYSIVLQSCLIKGNSALSDERDWERGGGLNIIHGSLVNIKDCIIEQNQSAMGGGICIESCEPNNVFIDSCVIRSNHAETNGGGIYSFSSPCKVSNCVISGNICSEQGGGICVEDSYDMFDIVNCTIVGNEGCGLFARERGTGVVVKNSIFRSNIPYQVKNQDGFCYGIELNYCNIESGWSFLGANNIDAEPDFARDGMWLLVSENPLEYQWLEGDYHLKSTAGRYVEDAKSWALDDISSVCIDAGDPNDPYDDEGPNNGNRINMGAYGGTMYASKSGYCYEFPPGDLNGDCQTNLADMAILCSGWLINNMEQ